MVATSRAGPATAVSPVSTGSTRLSQDRENRPEEGAGRKDSRRAEPLAAESAEWGEGGGNEHRAGPPLLNAMWVRVESWLAIVVGGKHSAARGIEGAGLAGLAPLFTRSPRHARGRGTTEEVGDRVPAHFLHLFRGSYSCSSRNLRTQAHARISETATACDAYGEWLPA
eukprot:GHVU01178100.1.p1 GENE.GHVU01178100.1~~GHVU01178100.1.p1  ORF type:complete len:169 (-),score=4.45 GHVU01178100.1:261-767(-)